VSDVRVIVLSAHLPVYVLSASLGSACRLTGSVWSAFPPAASARALISEIARPVVQASICWGVAARAVRQTALSVTPQQTALSARKGSSCKMATAPKNALGPAWLASFLRAGRSAPSAWEDTQ
jgi:hypothetical protein